MSNEYNIQSINDLFTVPPDRRQACVDELLTALTSVEKITKDVKPKLPRWLQFLAKPKIKTFVWIDDNRKDQTYSYGPFTLFSKKDPS